MSYLDQITIGSTTYDIQDAAVPSWARASSAPVESVNSLTGVVTLTAADVSALPASTAIPSVASDVGAIAAPASATTDAVLAYNGTAWVADKRMVILSYGSSTWNDFINAYNNNAVIYCRASSNSNPATGAQGRMAFMAYVDNGTSPTSVEFQYYRSVSSHSYAQQGDQVFIYKLTSGGTWTVTTREAYTKIVPGAGLSSNYNNGTLTLAADMSAIETGIGLDERYGVVISDTEPTNPDVNGWINPSDVVVESIPQIDDSQTSYYDTYSSAKIDSSYLSYDSIQNLTSAQQEQVTSNMGFSRDVANTDKYCKFPDGTMIQWGYKELKSGTTSNYSPLYLQGATITFPTSFMNTDYAVFGSARWGTGAELPFGAIENTAVGSTTVRLWDIVSRTSTSTSYWRIRWMAIGRWK